MMVDLLIVLATVIICLAATYLLINNDFVLIYFLCFIFLATAAWASSASWIQDGLVVLSALLLSLAIAEGVLWFVEPEELKTKRKALKYTKSYSQPLRRNGGELGYEPYPARTVRSWKTAGRERLYDVVYTINNEGYRQVPGFTGDEAGKAPVVFFGGSMAFGEGVNDGETLPYFIAAQTGWTRPVLNLGFSGYGPHQMLRSLELGKLRRLGYESIAVAIYEAVPGHAARAAGEAWWDPIGPRYELGTAGSVVYRGRFTNVPDTWIQIYYRYLQLARVARRSRVVDWTLNLMPASKTTDPEGNVRLMLAIVAKAAAILERDYGADFVVLFWDNETAESSLILEALTETDIPVIKVSDSIPLSAQADYRIPNDGHATPAANRLLADSLIPYLSDRGLATNSNVDPRPGMK